MTIYRVDVSTVEGGYARRWGKFIRGRFLPNVSSNRHLQPFDQLSTFEERRDGSEIVLPKRFQEGRLVVVDE